MKIFFSDINANDTSSITVNVLKICHSDGDPTVAGDGLQILTKLGTHGH